MSDVTDLIDRDKVARELAKASGVSDWKYVSEHGDYDSRDYWRRLADAAIAAVLEQLPAPTRPADDGPITQAEMVQLFGEAMPIEAVNLLWSSLGERTLRELRAQLREIATIKQTDAVEAERGGCDYCRNDGPLVYPSGWVPRCPRCDAEYPEGRGAK